MDTAGVQILITRTQSGQVKAFVNMCSHRGAKLMAEGCGHANKFTCPYHAWTFSTEGDLVAIYSNDQFGDLDKSEHGLTELPCLERAGLIWVTVDPNSELPIEDFLSGYDALLAEFGFETWHYHSTQRVAGAGGRWPMMGTSVTTLTHLASGNVRYRDWQQSELL